MNTPETILMDYLMRDRRHAAAVARRVAGLDLPPPDADVARTRTPMNRRRRLRTIWSRT